MSFFRASIVLASLLAAARAEAADGEPESAVLRRLMLDAETFTALRVRFGKGQTMLSAANRAALDGIAGRIVDYAGIVLIEAFSDGDGEASLNEELAGKRADLVRAYLLEKAGGAPPRTVTRNYGARLARGDTSAAKAEERAVLVTLVDREALEKAGAALATLGSAGAAPGGPLAPASANAPVQPFYVPPPPTVAVGGPNEVEAEPESTEQSEAASPPKSKERRRIRRPSLAVGVLSFFAPSAPATFDRPVYRSLAATGQPVYGARESGPMESQGFGIILQRRAPTTSCWDLGIRYRQYRAFESDSVYEAGPPGDAASTGVKATATGLWLQGLPLAKIWKSGLGAQAGFGLDLDYSQVELTQTFDDSAGNAFLSGTTTATSSVLIASLRTAGGMTFESSGYRIGATIAFQIPLAEAGRKTESDGNAQQAEAILRHRRALGTEVGLSLTRIF